MFVTICTVRSSNQYIVLYIYIYSHVVLMQTKSYIYQDPESPKAQANPQNQSPKPYWIILEPPTAPVPLFTGLGSGERCRGCRGCRGAGRRGDTVWRWWNIIKMVVSLVMGVSPIAGWLIRENPTKMDDLWLPH